MRAFDPKTDPRACSHCKDEDVAEVAEKVPSGTYNKIRCANGHVTHGMPTKAYFVEQVRETHPEADNHGNWRAKEGCDRCECGCKYWEMDRCIDCGARFPAVTV